MHQKSSDLVLPGPPFAGRLAELAANILKAGLFESPKFELHNITVHTGVTLFVQKRLNNLAIILHLIVAFVESLA